MKSQDQMLQLKDVHGDIINQLHSRKHADEPQDQENEPETK